MATPYTAPQVYLIAKKLSRQYQDFHHHNKKNPLDELLFIICSIKRSEAVYLRAFRSLKQAFPRFQDLSAASASEKLKGVFWGGLQNQKTKAVRLTVKAIEKRFGKPTLAPLKKMQDEECEKFLTALPGVGKKVARCVMLFSLNREVFPVDTHCWRISKRLGWIDSSFKSKNCSSANMDRLQEKIPPALRYSLHVNMVSHGRKVCSAKSPKCGCCPISKYCSRQLHASNSR